MKIYMTISLLALREKIASEIYFCSIYFCDLGPQNQRNLLNFFLRFDRYRKVLRNLFSRWTPTK